MIKRGEQMEEGGKGESRFWIKMMEGEREKLWRGEGESLQGTIERLGRV